MSQTERPLPAPPPAWKWTASHKALAGLLAFLFAAKIVELLARVPFASTAQAGVFSWQMTIFIACLALLGSGFAHIIGFPGMWEESISWGKKVLLPLGVGVVIGAALLGADRWSGFALLYAAAAGVHSLVLSLPFSTLFQIYTGVSAAVLYDLFALSFTVWFIGTLLLARRWPSATFWVLAVLVALWEPYMMASQQHWALFHSAHFGVGVVGVLALVYLLDLTAMIFIRRFGFTAALVLRLSAVTVWHIVGRH